MKTGLFKETLRWGVVLLSCAVLSPLTGCSDDDELPSTVVGSWAVVKAEGYEIVDGVRSSYWDTYNVGEYTMQFQPDGNGVEVIKRTGQIPEYTAFRYEYIDGAKMIRIIKEDGRDELYDVENLTPSTFTVSNTKVIKPEVTATFLRLYMSRLQ